MRYVASVRVERQALGGGGCISKPNRRGLAAGLDSGRGCGLAQELAPGGCRLQLSDMQRSRLNCDAEVHAESTRDASAEPTRKRASMAPSFPVWREIRPQIAIARLRTPSSWAASVNEYEHAGSLQVGCGGSWLSFKG